MMCFRDRWFCPFWEECSKGASCSRRMDQNMMTAAKRWWGVDCPDEEIPIARYVDKPNCFIAKEINDK